jgi:hypothetical protein
MRPGGAGAALLAAALAAGPVAAQEVSVRYVAPERFTDAENRYSSGQPLRATLAEMTRIFEETGRRRLAPGDSLAVTVLDIDLAGFERPSFGAPQGLRVVTDAAPPRIRLAYALRRGGRVAARGEETLTDINFLLTANARLATGGLFYERVLVRDWFARRFSGQG